jgi:GR25 family glycosyltransferase involved in LPS biosynthesis
MRIHFLSSSVWSLDLLWVEYSIIMNNFHALVINVHARTDRRVSISQHLVDKGVKFEIVRAVEPEEPSSAEKLFLTDTAKAVWLSHQKCLKIAAIKEAPTLILEDDAVLKMTLPQIEALSSIMSVHGIDFIQLGYLNINVAETVSIKLRNTYGFFTRNAIASGLFRVFGFKEVGRAKKQTWRTELPKNFVVNDVRYGAHCYLVSPKFASQILALNSPAFLPADDFYVALSRAKSFKMIRLKESLCQQDGSESSFSKRFLLN